MKIDILISELNVRGGSQKQVVRLAQYLIKQGHNVNIYTYWCDLENCYSELKSMNVFELVSLESRIKFFRFLNIWKSRIWLFNKLKASGGPINVHDNGFQWVIIFLKLMGSARKIIWQINDLPSCFKQGIDHHFKTSINDKIRQFPTVLAAKLVDKITVNVSKNKDRISRLLGQDSEVIYCGVDLPINSPSIPSIGCLHNNELQLLTISVLFPYRNYEAIVDAQKLLLEERGLRLPCVAVGQTSMSVDYKRKIEEYSRQLDVDFRFVGQLNERELDLVFHKKNIFMFMNIDQSWGLAIFEAMARGVPCVISNSVGAVEILKHKEGVLIVSPTSPREVCDAVLYLTDSANYSAQSRLAAERASQMSWDDMYSSKVENLFMCLNNDGQLPKQIKDS